MQRLTDPECTTVRIARDTRKLMDRVARRRRWSLKTIVDEGVKRLLAEDAAVMPGGCGTDPELREVEPVGR